MNDSKIPSTVVNRLPKLFYGWWILLGVAVLSFVMALVSFDELTTFRRAIEDSLLESDPLYPTNTGSSPVYPLLVPLISGLVIAPVVGFLLDQYGPRSVMLFVILVTGSAFLLITQIQNELQMHAGLSAISIGTFSITSVVLVGTLGKWFVHRRVLAFAVVSVCSTFASMFSIVTILAIWIQAWQITAIVTGTTLLMVGIPVALIVRHQPEWLTSKRALALAVVSACSTFALIFSVATLLAFEILAWQITAIVAGATLLMVGIPVALTMRHQPEDHGLLPDGVAEHGDHSRREVSATACSAARIPAFWQLVFAGGLALGAMSALPLNPQNLSLYDVWKGDIFRLLYLGIFIEMIGVLAVGFISLRLRKSVLILASLALVAIAQSVLIVFYFVDDFSFGFLLFSVFSIVISVAKTAIRLLQLAILADYFGRRNFGTIIGITIAVNTVTSFLPHLAFYPFSYFANDIMGFHLTQFGLGVVAIASAAILILKLEPQSRVAARIRRANHTLSRASTP